MYGKEPAYHAPSFSWASVRGQINSSGPFAAGFLVDVACVTLSNGGTLGGDPFVEDVFGPLTVPRFRLRVKGRLKVARLYQIEDDWLMEPLSTTDGDNDAGRGCAISAYLDFDVQDSDSAMFESEEFYFIPWRCGPDPGEPETDNIEVHCMLLQRLKQNVNAFRRIGWVCSGQIVHRRILLHAGSDDLGTESCIFIE